jgi:bacteriorhodopsin
MIENLLLWTNTAVFGTVLVKEIAYDSNPKLPGVQKASAAIMGIAMTQYAITAIIHGKHRTAAQDLRYVDWVATTPLLLYTYWALARERGWQGAYMPMAVAVVTMIALGFAAEITQDKNMQLGLFAASLVPYAFILREILGMKRMLTDSGYVDDAALANFFIWGWAAYPVGFFLPETQKYIVYSLADFVNKAVYSIMLENVLRTLS